MKRAEKQRLVKLGVVLGVCVMLMGVVKPWKRGGDDVAVVDPNAEETGEAAASANFVGGGVVDGSAREPSSSSATAADLVAVPLASGRALNEFRRALRAAPLSAPTRDPFFFDDELRTGVTHEAARVAAEKARAEAAAVAAATVSEANASSAAAADAAPADDEAIASFKESKLLGFVRSADGGAVLLQGKGRVRVGEIVRDTPFVLKEIRGAVAVFESKGRLVELSITKRRAAPSSSEDS